MPDYSILPDHMQNAMKMYIEERLPPGDFLQAVLENNLMESFSRADATNAMRMRDFCDFLYNQAPLPCHGSPEKVKAWLGG